MKGGYAQWVCLTGPFAQLMYCVVVSHTQHSTAFRWLLLLPPGVQYARSKHVESRKRRQLCAEAAQLEVPLLGGSAGSAGAARAAGEAGEAVLPPLYSLWWSKLFWSGIVLLLLSAGLAVLTVFTALYPLPEV